MPKNSPYSIELSSAEKIHLESQARKYTSPYIFVVRAKMILMAAQGLQNDQIARANKLTEDKRLVAFLDQGIFGSPGNAAALSAALGLDQYCDVKSEQDSRSVKGLQLADLVAHTGGVMLLETLGLLKSR